MASHGKGLEDHVANSDFYMVLILTPIRARSSLGTVLMFTSCGEGFFFSYYYLFLLLSSICQLQLLFFVVHCLQICQYLSIFFCSLKSDYWFSVHYIVCAYSISMLMFCHSVIDKDVISKLSLPLLNYLLK